MTQMTKRGKVKNTHTLSAAQILGTLPDSFILRHVSLEPRHVFHETLSWIGKDELSPELQERSAKRNAVKRYSAHRSPIKAPTSSLLSSRNSVNEMLVELREQKERTRQIEKAMDVLKESSSNLMQMNSDLSAQVKLLLEENSLLKRHLNEPKTISRLPMNILSRESTCNLSYANVADISKPMNKSMKFYTKSFTSAPSSPIEVVSAKSSIPIPNSSKHEFSPLKMVFFKGCHRKSINTYKKMLPNIGFEPHWARHIVFLAEDIIQITTFESKADALINAMESISPKVKHLQDFDPLLGSSYLDYGNFSDESATKSYLSLMKQCATKLQNDYKTTPSLRRIALFISKVVEQKDIHYQPIPRASRVFWLGDVMIKKDPPTDAMDIETQDLNTKGKEEMEIDQAKSQNDANECKEADNVESVKPNDQ